MDYSQIAAAQAYDADKAFKIKILAMLEAMAKDIDKLIKAQDEQQELDSLKTAAMAELSKIAKEEVLAALKKETKNKE